MAKHDVLFEQQRFNLLQTLPKAGHWGALIESNHLGNVGGLLMSNGISDLASVHPLLKEHFPYLTGNFALSHKEGAMALLSERHTETL